MALCKVRILVGALLLVTTFQTRIKQVGDLTPHQPEKAGNSDPLSKDEQVAASHKDMELNLELLQQRYMHPEVISTPPCHRRASWRRRELAARSAAKREAREATYSEEVMGDRDFWGEKSTRKAAGATAEAAERVARAAAEEAAAAAEKAARENAGAEKPLATNVAKAIAAVEAELKKTWSKPEAERKDNLRRLWRLWHPDKREDRLLTSVLLATEVMKYLNGCRDQYLQERADGIAGRCSRQG